MSNMSCKLLFIHVVGVFAIFARNVITYYMPGMQNSTPDCLVTLLKYFNIPPWFRCTPSLDRNDTCRSAQKPRGFQNIMLLLLSDEINCFIDTFICVTHRHLFLSMGATSSLFLERKREEGALIDKKQVPVVQLYNCNEFQHERDAYVIIRQ